MEHNHFQGLRDSAMKVAMVPVLLLVLIYVLLQLPILKSIGIALCDVYKAEAEKSMADKRMLDLINKEYN